MRRSALAAQGVAADDIAAIDSLRPDLTQFDPRAATGAGAVTDADRAPFILAVFLSFILWSAVFGVANMLLTSVLEEKSNKILDSLLTSATPLQILIGKLTGVAAVSATLFALWGGLGAGIVHLVSQQSPSSAVTEIALAAFSPELFVIFLLCFAMGYLMFGAVFLALGSLCDTTQEAQTLLGPFFLVLTAPVLLLGPAFENPNAPLVAAAAWIPPFTPFVTMMRAPAGAPWIELAGPMALMAVTLVAVLMGAARVFRAGLVERADASALRRKLSPFGKGKAGAA
jgi:ABC-2 type transport system permease protein